jgi:serine/threonine protein kinase
LCSIEPSSQKRIVHGDIKPENVMLEIKVSPTSDSDPVVRSLATDWQKMNVLSVQYNDEFGPVFQPLETVAGEAY